MPLNIRPDVRRLWDRAKNQYDYAIKVREESRIINIIAQVLQPLADKYTEVPAVRALLGSMLLKVGRRAEAIEHLRMAAYTKGHPNYWKALAFAAAESALECHALKHLLLLTVPHHDHDCWLRYLSLSFAYSDARGMIGVMEKCFSQEMNSSIHEMATEALIYVYGRIGAEMPTQSATIALINGRSPIQEGGGFHLKTGFPYNLQSSYWKKNVTPMKNLFPKKLQLFHLEGL